MDGEPEMMESLCADNTPLIADIRYSMQKLGQDSRHPHGGSTHIKTIFELKNQLNPYSNHVGLRFDEFKWKVRCLIRTTDIFNS